MKVDTMRVKVLMVKRGLNQSQLANEAGIARSTLYWFFKRSKGNLSTLAKITKVLNVDPSEIIKE